MRTLSLSALTVLAMLGIMALAFVADAMPADRAQVAFLALPFVFAGALAGIMRRAAR